MKSMLKVMVVSALAAITLNGPAQSDTYTVPTFRWVTVMNPDGIKSGNGFHGFGQTCSIQEGGKVEKLGVKGDQTLVRYMIPILAYGAPCPAGTVFFVESQVLPGWDSQHKKIIAERDTLKDEIKLLIPAADKK